MKRSLRRRNNKRGVKSTRVKRKDKKLRMRKTKNRRNKKNRRNRRKFNSKIRSIFKKTLKRKKQRGGHSDSTSQCDNSSSNRGGTFNTLSALNKLPGGTAVADAGLSIGNSLSNLHNNFIGQSEAISPNVTLQPIGN